MTKTLTLVRGKDCKHSVVYKTDDPDQPISSVYLSRSFRNPMPAQITLTITDEPVQNQIKEPRGS